MATTDDRTDRTNRSDDGPGHRADTADVTPDVGLAGDLVIERTVELDVGRDELWALVKDAAGWQRWIVDAADLTVRDGAIGHIVDGEVARTVRIGAVDEGRSVSFTWWEHGDESSASEVLITIIGGEDGGSGITITERIPAAAIARASVTAEGVETVRFAWEVRACLAWATTLSAVQV